MVTFRVYLDSGLQEIGRKSGLIRSKFLELPAGEVDFRAWVCVCWEIPVVHFSIEGAASSSLLLTYLTPWDSVLFHAPMTKR